MFCYAGQVNNWVHGTLTWNLNAGLPLAEIAAQEARLGHTLPLEVIASYALYDGQSTACVMPFLLSRSAHLPLKDAVDEALWLPSYWGGDGLSKQVYRSLLLDTASARVHQVRQSDASWLPVCILSVRKITDYLCALSVTGHNVNPQPRFGADASCHSC